MKPQLRICGSGFLGGWKRSGGTVPRASEETMTCDTWISGPGLQNCEGILSCWLQTPAFLVISYSSSRKLVQITGARTALGIWPDPTRRVQDAW